jgi:uncharacterized membrane protein YphA (DoxX/SURF4 family)
MDTIMGQVQGQPTWLKPWFDFWINLQHPQAAFFAYLIAAVKTLIAIALIASFARKITYISAAVFSLLIWATAVAASPAGGSPIRPSASLSSSTPPSPSRPDPASASRSSTRPRHRTA